MKRTKIKTVLRTTPPNSPITLCGWVRTRRDSKGGFSFIEINDGSCGKGIQIIAKNTLPNYTDEILHLTTGCSIKVVGTVVASPGKKQAKEVQAEKISVFGWAEPETYPLQKKRHSFEFLRQIAHLRPRTNTVGAVSRIRNQLSIAIHTFFQNNDFTYIHTPIITTNDCEGAGELFRVTSLNLSNLPTENGNIDFSADFFGQSAYLTVSGQLEAEIYALALGDVYTFGPTFRAENSNTSRHLAEFWMVEPEMAFCDLNQDAKIAEEFMKYIISNVLEQCTDDLELFNRFIDTSLLNTLNHIVNTPFKHFTYKQALDILIKSNVKFEFPVSWESGFQAEHERYLTEQYCKAPVIITDYPEQIKPFYMRISNDGKTVAAMDVLFPKIGEIIGGSQREERYDILLERIIKQGLSPDEYWWYLDLRKYGTVPHAGFGLGFDRLVQFVTGMNNIRDIIPFPRTPKNAGF